MLFFLFQGSIFQKKEIPKVQSVRIFQRLFQAIILISNLNLNTFYFVSFMNNLNIQFIFTKVHFRQSIKNPYFFNFSDLKLLNN